MHFFKCLLATQLLLGFTLVASSVIGRKEVNLTKLEEEYKDGDKSEDDEWHEDSFDWKEKMNKKKGVPKTEGPVLPQHRRFSVKMYQVRLKTDFCGHEKCTFKESEEMSRRYQQFLRNANIQVKPYTLGIGELMFVDSDAHFAEVHKFLMAQPEVYRMQVNGQKFYPPGVERDDKIERPPDPHPPRRKVKVKRSKNKKKKKKGKKKKGKKKKGKKTKDSKEQKKKSEL